MDRKDLPWIIESPRSSLWQWLQNSVNLQKKKKSLIYTQVNFMVCELYINKAGFKANGQDL